MKSWDILTAARFAASQGTSLRVRPKNQKQVQKNLHRMLKRHKWIRWHVCKEGEYLVIYREQTDPQG